MEYNFSMPPLTRLSIFVRESNDRLSFVVDAAVDGERIGTIYLLLLSKNAYTFWANFVCFIHAFQTWFLKHILSPAAFSRSVLGVYAAFIGFCCAIIFQCSSFDEEIIRHSCVYFARKAE